MTDLAAATHTLHRDDLLVSGRLSPMSVPLFGDAWQACQRIVDAEILGFDVIGFSRLTRRLMADLGAGAAEQINHILGARFQEAASVLSGAGFEIADTLGDGLLAFRPRQGKANTPSDMCAIARAVEDGVSPARHLRVRVAWSDGPIRLCRLGGWQGIWHDVALGDAVHALYVRSRLMAAAAVAVDDGPAVTDGGKAAPDPIAEIRWQAILFARVADSVDVQSLSLALLTRIVDTAQRAALTNGGVLEKITHDDKGLLLRMTFDRAPTATGTAVDSAIDCAADLSEEMERCGLKTGFGLSDGPVYRGPFHFDGHRSLLSVHGDAVNLAAKLSAVDPPALRFAPPDMAKAQERLLRRGLDIPRRRLELTDCLEFGDGLLPHSQRERAGSRGLVGRETVLLTLAEKLPRRGNAPAHIVQLQGAPGVGKSAILNALLGKLDAGTACFTVHMTPRQVDGPLSFWRKLTPDILSRLCKMRRQAARDLLEGLFAEIGIARDLFSVFNQIAGDLFEETVLSASIDGAGARQLLEQMIVHLVRSVTAREPLVLAIDDAHWLDVESARLLARVAEDVQALLIVATARQAANVFTAQTQQGLTSDQVSLIEVQALDEQHLARLIRLRQPARDFSAAFLSAVHGLTGGNPFYAEQIAGWLDEILPPPADGHAQIGPEALDVIVNAADGLGHLLSARLDALSPEATHQIRFLSIIDHPLAPEDVARLDAEVFGDGRQRAALLASNGLLVREPNKGSYLVKHRLISDMVIARTPPSHKAILHAQAARFLTRRRREAQEISIGDALLAQHWLEAGYRLRAALCKGRAADAALNAGSYAAAIVLYDEAIALSGAPERMGRSMRVARWHAAVASAHWSMGSIRRATHSTDLSLGCIDRRLGRFARTKRMLMPLVGLSRWALPADVRAALLLANVVRGETAYYLGDLKAIVSANLTALPLANDACLQPAARARALAFLGYMMGLLRLTPLAQLAFGAGRGIGDSDVDGRPSAYVCAAEAVWHLSFARWPLARAQLETSRRLASNPPDPHQIEVAVTLLAIADYLEGDPHASRDRFRELRSRGSARGNALHHAWGIYGEVEAMLQSAHATEMVALLGDAERLLENLNDLQSRLICMGLRAQLHFRAGEHLVAWHWTQVGTEAARRLAVNNFSALEGFAGPAEIGWRLAAEIGGTCAPASEIARTAGLALGQLRRYAQVHPIGRPRYLLCKGLRAKAKHDGATAHTLFDKGLHLARAHGMRGEEMRLMGELSTLGR